MSLIIPFTLPKGMTREQYIEHYKKAREKAKSRLTKNEVSCVVQEYTDPDDFGLKFKYFKDIINGKTTRIPLGLKPHQIEVLKWMQNRESNPHHGMSGAILGLQMGTGKSLLAISIIMSEYSSSKPPEWPTIVVCPLSAIYTWKEQIEFFFGTSCPYIIIRPDVIGKKMIDSLTPEIIKNYRIVITNFENLRCVAKRHNIYDDAFELDRFGRRSYILSPAKPNPTDKKGDCLFFHIPWRRVVIDESHVIRNCKTATFYTVMSLWGQSKWALTGTPLVNRSTDLFSQFRLIGFSKITDSKKFTTKVFGEYNLSENILYMTLEEAGIILPGMNIIPEFIKMSDKQREFYDYLRNKTSEAVEGFHKGVINFASVLTMFLRLRQCCIAPYTILKESSRDYKKTGQNQDEQEIIQRLDDDTAKWLKNKNTDSGIYAPKIVRALEIIEKEVPSNEKIIIFTSFKRVIDLCEIAIKAKFPDMQYETIDGDVTGTDRNNALDRFKSDKNKRVLFLSLTVGSQSLNLTEANNIIQLETCWNNATFEQANGRANRIGQKKEVKVWRLIAENSIEYRMLQLCHEKSELWNQFTGKKSRENEGLTIDMIERFIMENGSY